MKTCLAVMLMVPLLFPRAGQATERADTTVLSVKDFGASGTGTKDDAPALIKCLTTATQHAGPVVVKIPYGVYKISRSLKVDMNKCNSLTIIGIPQDHKLPEIKTDQFINLLEVYSHDWAPKGKVTIRNLSLVGNNPPYSANHPYYDKPAFRTGISVLNLKQADISDNYVSNVYGNGIGVTYSSGLFKNLKNRYTRVVIKNNHVLNCWGLHPTKVANKSHDDYGDGIYTNCVKNGIIAGNQVINDLNVTKQFGRGGITLEYNDEDCQVLNNHVSGYDRNIHLEQDIGGHLIKGNTLEGSDFGILVYDVPKAQNKPIRIVDNTITNKGLSLNSKVKRVRNSEERCLLSFYAKGNIRKGSKIAGNHFIIDSRYAYPYSSITRFNAQGLIIKNNTFSSNMPPNKMKSVSFLVPVDTLSNNQFRDVHLKLFQGGKGQMISNNKTVAH